jgi:hypothetical protein
VYNADYPVGAVSLGLLREAGIEVRQLEIGAQPERAARKATKVCHFDKIWRMLRSLTWRE